MRLGSKIFLTSALVIIVLAGVGGLSLLAVDRLVSVNREITTRAVPALRLIDTDARGLAEEVQESLDALMAATHTQVLAAQAEAARLEVRTWTAVLIALGAAVGLALLATAAVAQRMTRSLALLSSATAEVAAGAFREPIAIESRAEIGARTLVQLDGEPAAPDG